jgi:hypothetical protein
LQLASPVLADLIPFLGHTTTVERPMPGLGLSYGETIGAIHQLWRRGYLKGDFKAEQDRILAAIRRNQTEQEAAERPDFEPLDEADDPNRVRLTPDPNAPRMSDLGSLEPPPPVDLPTPGRDTVPR